MAQTMMQRRDQGALVWLVLIGAAACAAARLLIGGLAGKFLI